HWRAPLRDACPVRRPGQTAPRRCREAALAFVEPSAICPGRGVFADCRARRLDRGTAALGQVRPVRVGIPQAGFLTRLPGCRYTSPMLAIPQLMLLVLVVRPVSS